MTSPKDHYAIVIGVDRYPRLATISATFAVPSAISFTEWLRTPDGAGVAPDNIFTLVSPPDLPADPLDAKPSCKDVDDLLSTLIEGKTQKVGERLYFYFAGLGSGSLQTDVLLLTANAAVDQPGGAISLRQYRQFLSRCFDEVVYVIDCAFVPFSRSPETPDPILPTLLGPQRTSVKDFILMSSIMGKHETEGGGDSSIGLLTKVVLEGLRGGAAAGAGPAVKEQDGVPARQITAVSLSDYVRARVRDLTTGVKLQQLPEMLLPNERIFFSTVNVSLLAGKLAIEVPHWTAEVCIYNNLMQLITGPLELKKTDKKTANKGDVYVAEVDLVEGIYRVDVSLEGAKESQLAVVQFNQSATIENESWKNLGFVSAAPLDGAVSTHEWHAGPAVKWSQKITWPEAPGGDSMLYLFVRTDEPKEYPRFAEGLSLLNATGELVIDFSSGVVKDETKGWFAFRAELQPGYYILRRQGPDIRLRHQPLFLCKDWETQIFLQARSHLSMRSQAVNMARWGSGFRPSDETAEAAEAVLDAIRYGGNIKHLVSHKSLSMLLREKLENPWLGVLAAYALRSQLDHSSEEDQDTRELLDHLMRFLKEKIGDHPDVRALQLELNKPAPQSFICPPLLIRGLRLVEHHSFRFKGTVPEGSLTDRVLDSLLVNSPWTAWRELPEPACTTDVTETAADESADAESVTESSGLAFAANTLQSSSPKAPLYRVSEFVGTSPKESSGVSGRQCRLTSVSVNSFQDAQLLGVVQTLTNVSDLDAVPETVTFNEGKQAVELLDNIKPGAISQAAGISLAHTQGSLQRLRELVNTTSSGGDTSAWGAELRPAEKVSLEYALAESAKTAENINEGVVVPHPAITIEDCVTAIRGEALSLLLAPDDEQPPESDVQAAKKIGQRLLDAADALLDRAAFTVTTDANHNIVYCNRAFITLLTAVDMSLTEEQREAKKNRNYIVWQQALSAIPIGSSVLTNPIEISTPREFRVRRTLIKEEGTDKSKAYLNTLKAKESRSVTPEILEQISELLPNLTRQASFFWYDSSERSAYTVKLEHLTTQLETTIGVTTMTPNNNLSTTTVSEFTDEDLVKPDSGLFDSEFWAVSRHELIADVAEQLLKPHTADRLKAVLKPLADQGFPTTLADLAGWADLTKHRGPKPEDDEETVAFLQDPANASRAKWHYVDLPLGVPEYSRELYPTFTSDVDVVQIATQAVRVLKGQSERFNPVNAVRLVVHLIGDLHQPVHVGCGYVDPTGAVPRLVFDPEVIAANGFEDDQGGNHIILPIGAHGAKLHEYWDSRLGGAHPDISGNGEGDAVEVTPELKRAFSQKLLRMIQADPVSDAPPAEADATSVEDWIVEWANDSLAAAHEAYKSIEITGPNGDGFDVTWEGKPAYDARCKPIVLQRMKSAARNLAALLDEIYA